MAQMYNPPHPGEILKECLSKMVVTDTAKRLGVTRVTLSRVLNGVSGISTDMALRLEAALGTSPEMWMGLQSAFELWKACQKPQPCIQNILASDPSVSCRHASNTSRVTPKCCASKPLRTSRMPARMAQAVASSVYTSSA